MIEQVRFNSQNQDGFSSILLLTILLAVGLVFFLRAASKDRTTVIDVISPLPPLEVLNGITIWLEKRGWKNDGGDANSQVLRFNGSVSSSVGLAVFLSVLGGLGSCCLGLVLIQLFPTWGWWPLLLAIVGAPSAGLIYRSKATRIECFELKLLNSTDTSGSKLRVRAHRDEIIALELDLSQTLQLSSDGSLMASPI